MSTDVIQNMIRFHSDRWFGVAVYVPEKTKKYFQVINVHAKICILDHQISNVPISIYKRLSGRSMFIKRFPFQTRNGWCIETYTYLLNYPGICRCQYCQ